jgi:hypothetical protein
MNACLCLFLSLCFFSLSRPSSWFLSRHSIKFINFAFPRIVLIFFLKHTHTHTLSLSLSLSLSHSPIHIYILSYILFNHSVFFSFTILSSFFLRGVPLPLSLPLPLPLLLGRHDIKYNGNYHNNIQHKDVRHNDTRHDNNIVKQCFCI